jgi:hypothetical protein
MASKPRYPRAYGTAPAKAQGRAAAAAVSITDDLLGGLVTDDLNGNSLIQKDA